MAIQISLPMTKEAATSLRAGDSVLLSGTIYTARDAAHKRLYEMMQAGGSLPFDLNGASIYYVGPSPAQPGMAVGSAGPTTSSRCDKYTPDMLDAGLRVMLGKGKRSQTVKDAVVRNGAVYLAATGGAGAMLARCVKTAEMVAFPELGTEAVRKLTIENFPAVVILDAHGGDYYETARQSYLKSIET
ncbi:MAG: Fe-S-containing hydro-lyase [Oscillospiraceae bacterium]|jgi:fumarate hydratase subunit beta|nr:Fe-S-containing hydro-lyase [Oscillospiraceae bacterium]